MTMTGQNFTVYQGMDRELAFTLDGVAAATDVKAATWKGAGISKTLGSGITAIDEDERVKVVVTLAAATTAGLTAGIYEHQLTATDANTKKDMTATGTMTVRKTL